MPEFPEMYRDGFYLRLKTKGSVLGQMVCQLNCLDTHSKDRQEEMIGVGDRIVDLWNKAIKGDAEKDSSGVRSRSRLRRAGTLKGEGR